MPGPPAQTSGLGQYGAFQAQVVHANSTLNAFVGGKQKPWMANATRVQPSPRPQPQPSRSQAQQSQQPLPPVLPTTPANVNVLPSPAPSDEPSPALSNPLDSPNPRTYQIPTATQKQSTGQSIQYSSSPQTASNSRPPYPAAAIAAAAGTLGPTAASEQATTETPSESVLASPGMAPPNPPQQNDGDQVENGGNDLGLPNVVPGRAEVQSSSASEDGRASKRRRVEGVTLRNPSDGMVTTSHSHVAPNPPAAAAGLTFADLASFIDHRVDQQGGEQALQPVVEKPRFHILRDACVKQDYFYLVLHQLYCLWSVNPQKVSDLLLGDMGTISMGFGILDSVLKKNSGFSRSNLEWCANFPCQHADLSHSQTVSNVATFLLRLADNWTALHEGSFNRVCPYLVDEMIGKLQCYSVVLQGILFTASRRRLGVLDGQLGTEMDHCFRKDQQDHIVDGQFRVLLASDEPGELERRNHDLIQRYQKIISAVEQQGQEIARQQQQFLARQQNLQIQQAQTQSPQQTQFQQSAFQPNSPYERQQNQIARVSYARRTSVQTALPLNTPPQRPIPSPTTDAPHHAINSPPIPQNVYISPVSGHMGHVPSALVLQSSSSGAIPSSPMVQSMHSPQAYAQGGVNQQQYSFGNQHVPAQNMQSVQYINPYTQNMVSMQTAAAQQHWPRERYPTTHPQMHAPRFANPPQIVHGHNTNLRPQVPQQVRANVPPAATRSHFLTTFVPRPGQVIERSDWPHAHQDKKSLMMSLHQAQARSPDRTRRADEDAERHYQAVRSLAIEPFRLVYFHELEFTVAPEIHSLLCRIKKVPPLGAQISLSTVREYTNRSLRYRLRCCRTNTDKSVAESDWVTKETSWPDYIFPHFNGEKLVVRRGTHHGKDLPVELTDFVVPGLNKLKVATMQAGPTADKIARSFHLAVEVVETLTHSAVLDHVWATGVVDSAETLEKIRKRIEVVPDEDGIAVIDQSGVTASELSIDLTDPFSASIFSIPARGSACTHMECFDLGTWLNTRPIKQTIKIGLPFVGTSPKRLEPSEPDKWKCPICFGDARPRSLRIDSFLLGVRRQLEEQNKLETKSILVGADGTWRPVVEPVDDEDAGSDGDGPVPKGPIANSRKQSSKSISVERAAVEIIELD
ncbi:hypothetical protein KVR01_001933 [Diaporthe batatas]|uniref:uncharacterized protein n=1 Tax=Diaporthe batatas TaxID=748121 RepID=UPI001D05BDFA|nr:uncharacterized protein KVR01_001933 [Diaporthe batatas]KAG8169184.1 hypothetical protein KVR01_001933 [Diaporthe batatas]